MIYNTGKDQIINTVKHRESASRVSPIFDQDIKVIGCAQVDNTRDISLYVDLVADLLHLAAARGVDCEQVLKRATVHFQAESVTPDDLAMTGAARHGG